MAISQQNFKITDKRILEEYPLPIAYEYMELLNLIDASWKARCEKLAQVFEFSLRYCTAIALSQYYAFYKDLHRPPSSVDKFVAEKIINPKLDMCVDILREIGKSYISLQEIYMPEMVSFCVTRDGGTADGLQLTSALILFASQTENTKAGSEKRAEDLYEKNIDNLKLFLWHLGFLCNYTLVRLIRQVAPNYWIVNPFMGAELDLGVEETINIENFLANDSNPERDMLGVFSSERGELLHLRRYAIFSPAKPPSSESDSEELTLLSPEQRRNLRKGIGMFFQLDELKILCKDLGVDFDNLQGETKVVKTDALIEYLEKRGRLAELIKLCAEEYPEKSWPDIKTTKDTSVFSSDNSDECQKMKRDFFLYMRQEPNKRVYAGLQNEDGQPIHLSLDGFIDELWRQEQYRTVSIVTEWGKIQEYMQNRTRDQLKGLKEKYNEDVYTERDAIQSNFAHFLTTTQTGFLVVGDSGAGKTNLLCDLVTRTLRLNGTAVLENAAAWDESVIQEGLDRFLAKRYSLDPELGFVGSLQKLQDRLDQSAQFVLFLDAINEFANPQRLLDAIYDALIVPTEAMPYFKIVLSCRTEHWDRLKDKFQGERRFYRSDGDSIAHKLEKFGPAELEIAYGKYKQKYHLQTGFADLSAQVKRFIAFPLMLRLTSESYVNEAIPGSLNTYSIFRRYLDQKLDDINKPLALREQLIVNHLVELMYDKRVDRLDYVSLFDDPKIGQLVMNDSMSGPWVDLLGKGVIMIVGDATRGTNVRFTYDQVLEFKLAEQVWPQSPTFENVKALIDEVSFDGSVFPSLWGAIKLALIARNDEDKVLHNDRLLFDLVSMDDPDTRAIMTDVLLTLSGQGEPRFMQVVDFIMHLVKEGNQSAGILCVEVAHRLISRELPNCSSNVKERSEQAEAHVATTSNVLEQGLYSTESYVRQIATQYTFFLLHEDERQAYASGNNRNIGIQLFRRVSDRVKHQLTGGGLIGVAARFRQGIDSVVGLRSLIDLGLLAISLGYRYPDGVRDFGQTLFDLIDSIPRPIRSLLDSALSTAHVGEQIILSGLDKLKTIQIRSLRPFFTLKPLGHKRREQCANLSQYFDPNKGSLQGELGDLVFDVAQEYDGLTYITIIMTIMPRVGQQLDSLYQFCRRLYTEGNGHAQWIALRVFTMACHMDSSGSYIRPEHIEFANQLILDFNRGQQKLIEYPWQEERNGPITHKLTSSAHIDYGCLIELATNIDQPLQFVQKVLELEWSLPEEDRTELIFSSLYDCVVMGVATTRFNIRPILKTLALWFDLTDLTPKEEKALVDALSGIRSFFPFETDNYLADARSQLRLSVMRNNRKPESLARIYATGLQVGAPMLFRTVPPFRQVFAEMGSELASSSNDADKGFGELGNRLVTTNMIRLIADGLKNAGVNA